ncbi:MAG: asparaginase [Xanthobacteraceae bacterium]|nr:asparaginase [Xanthobacteraceae bacterium]
MTRQAEGGIVPTLTAADLVQSVPCLDKVAQIETISPLRKPGASLTLDDLIDLAQMLRERLAGDTDGAVVIQGTDTIEETAFVLDCLLDGSKPVVVTGAMRGPEAAGADGPANLLAAVIVAASGASRDRGTLVVLNDEIHAARFVQKSHTALPSAFRSPLGGTVGLVIEGAAAFHGRTTRGHHVAGPLAKTDAPVALIKMALGEDDRLLRALPSLGYVGAVVEGMGVGHVPACVVDAISALAKTMPVVLASRIDTGPVFSQTYAFPGSEIDLIGHGLISARSLSGLKARLLLILLLHAGRDRDAIADVFARIA